MRKAPKVILFTAAALIGTGTLLAGGAWASVGFDASKLSTTEYDWRRTVQTFEDETTAPHKRIVVNSNYENVRIEPTESDAIELEYRMSNAQDVTAADTDGTLTIDCRTSFEDGVVIDLPDPDDEDEGAEAATVVRVPATFAGTIEVNTDASDIFAEKLSGLESLIVASDDGSIVMRKIDAGAVEARNQNGDTLLSAITGDQLTATNQNGDISLGSAEVQTATFENRNGDITLVNVSAASKLACKNADGDTSSEGTAIASGAFSSTNGDIDVICRGGSRDYRIDAFSQAGEVFAPRGNLDAARTIRAESECGDVSLDFSGDE